MNMISGADSYGDIHKPAKWRSHRFLSSVINALSGPEGVVVCVCVCVCVSSD